MVCNIILFTLKGKLSPKAVDDLINSGLYSSLPYKPVWFITFISYTSIYIYPYTLFFSLHPPLLIWLLIIDN